jgi:hypothetical protein
MAAVRSTYLPTYLPRLCKPSPELVCKFPVFHSVSALQGSQTNAPEVPTAECASYFERGLSSENAPWRGTGISTAPGNASRQPVALVSSLLSLYAAQKAKSFQLAPYSISKGTLSCRNGEKLLVPAQPSRWRTTP